MVILEDYGKQKNIFPWNKVNVYEWFELFIFFFLLYPLEIYFIRTI